MEKPPPRRGSQFVTTGNNLLPACKDGETSWNILLMSVTKESPHILINSYQLWIQMFAWMSAVKIIPYAVNAVWVSRSPSV